MRIMLAVFFSLAISLMSGPLFAVKYTLADIAAVQVKKIPGLKMLSGHFESVVKLNGHEQKTFYDFRMQTFPGGEKIMIIAPGPDQVQFIADTARMKFEYLAMDGKVIKADLKDQDAGIVEAMADMRDLSGSFDIKKIYDEGRKSRGKPEKEKKYSELFTEELEAGGKFLKVDNTRSTPVYAFLEVWDRQYKDRYEALKDMSIYGKVEIKKNDSEKIRKIKEQILNDKKNLNDEILYASVKKSVLKINMKTGITEEQLNYNEQGKEIGRINVVKQEEITSTDEKGNAKTASFITEVKKKIRVFDGTEYTVNRYTNYGINKPVGFEWAESTIALAGYAAATRAKYETDADAKANAFGLIHMVSISNEYSPKAADAMNKAYEKKAKWNANREKWLKERNARLKQQAQQAQQ